MDFTLRIIQGNDVLALIKDDEFASSWLELAKKDNKVTVIQDYPFCITWYNQYKGRYTPILCLGYSTTGELVGLMPLATRLNNCSIAHAGDWQAEYHGWIAHPEIDEDFPIACLIEVKHRFSIKIWQWGCLPPGAPVNWLSSELLSKQNIYVKYRKQSSRLWDLTDKGRLEKLIRNKAIKNQTNRYKKQGAFYLERIKDKNRTQKLLDILAPQYDLRQETVHGSRPFTDDNNKVYFYIKRQNYPDAIHFTVLWSNDKALAFNFGACNGERVLLGVYGINPLEVNNSPGNLLLVELAKMLPREGYRYIDLTPGLEDYKQRFSNAAQVVYQPTFYFRKKDYIKSQVYDKVRVAVKKGIMVFGMSPGDIRKLKDTINEYSKRLRRITIRKLLIKLYKMIYEKRIYLYYRLEGSEVELGAERDAEINVQQFEDLLGYTGANPWKSRRELLSEALERFKVGDVLYSVNKDGVLAHYGWMTRGGKTHSFTEVDMTFESPQGSMILYGFYTEPKFRRKGLYQRNLRRMVSDSYKSGAKEIYIGAAHDNIPSRRAIEKVGFSLFRTFSTKRFLWIVKKGAYHHE